MQAAQTSLQDAVKAYDAGSYATATVMAAVAAEHLARGYWLLNYGTEIRDSEIECESFVGRFEKYVESSRHEERLQQSLYGFTCKLPPIQEVLDGFKGDAKAKAQSLFRLIDKMKKRAGASFHDLRQQAQYIEPLKNCGGWSTPTAVSESGVHDFLMNVANSYGALLMLGFFDQDVVQAATKRLGLDQSLTITKGNWPAPEGKE